MINPNDVDVSAEIYWCCTCNIEAVSRESIGYCRAMHHPINTVDEYERASLKWLYGPKRYALNQAEHDKAVRRWLKGTTVGEET